VLNLPSKAVSGNRLTPEAREQFVAAANALYNAKKGNYDHAVQYYSGRAQAFGIDPVMVIRDHGSQEKQATAPALDDATLRAEYEQFNKGAEDAQAADGDAFFHSTLNSVFNMFAPTASAFGRLFK
jgi:hypothetical protein